MANDLEYKNADILIIDDTPAELKLLNGLLKAEGYKVRLIPDGKTALNAIDNKPPALILLDINMPDMNGYEVCKKLKSSPKTRDIPIIFLTANTEIEDIAKGFKLGAVDYVTKPFNSDELLVRIKTHLQLTLFREKIIDLNAKQREANKEQNDWNEKFGEKLDQKTKDILKMNKILIKKNEILKCRDSILKFLLVFHPITESMQFILSRIIQLMELQRIVVYISSDDNEFTPKFGLTHNKSDSLMEEEEICKYPNLPGMSQTQIEEIIEQKDKVIKWINEYSLILPLVKEKNLLGYILLDNTLNKKHVDETDIETGWDFSILVAYVLNDYLIRNSYSDMESSIEDILSWTHQVCEQSLGNLSE